MQKLFFSLLLAVDIFALEASFEPLLFLNYDESRAHLGKKLFFDKRLSSNENYSCETCHNLYWDFSGTNSKYVQKGTLNPPSILNAASNYIFYNDGRIRGIHAQVKESITSRYELNSGEDKILTAVKGIEEYEILFARIYKDGITYENIVDAFVEFEKAILTINSPFDRYLAGDESALGESEKKGFEIFKNLGCVACHNGKNLGANLMQDVRFSKDILAGVSSQSDMNKRLYRVPSLRNIAVSAPYLMDGSIMTLKEAIKHIGANQFMYDLSGDEIDALYKFLLSLSGERPRIMNEPSSN